MLKLVGPNNSKLKTVCKFTCTEKAIKLSKFMMLFCKTYPCLGVSANQFGILERVCVAKTNGKFKSFINPQIINRSSKTQLSLQEGCLSFPGIRGDIIRPLSITVTWLTFHNWVEKRHEEIFTGQDAIVLEHEIDHLDGIRCIDKMKNKRYTNG